MFLSPEVKSQSHLRRLVLYLRIEFELSLFYPLVSIRRSHYHYPQEKIKSLENIALTRTIGTENHRHLQKARAVWHNCYILLFVGFVLRC